MLDQIGEFQIFEILSEIPQTQFCRQVGIGRTMFWNWLQQDPARREKLQDAKRARADKLADEALAIADGVGPMKPAVAKARLQVGIRKFLVAALEQGGPTAVPTVQQMHLEALKAVAAEERAQHRAQSPTEG
jgi:hypothetical protein